MRGFREGWDAHALTSIRHRYRDRAVKNKHEICHRKCHEYAAEF